MTVVADSSPLIAFCRIGKINLLEELFATCSYITLIIAHVKKYYNDKVLLTPSYDYPA